MLYILLPIGSRRTEQGGLRHTQHSSSTSSPTTPQPARAPRALGSRTLPHETCRSSTSSARRLLKQPALPRRARRSSSLTHPPTHPPTSPSVPRKPPRTRRDACSSSLSRRRPSRPAPSQASGLGARGSGFVPQSEASSTLSMSLTSPSRTAMDTSASSPPSRDVSSCPSAVSARLTYSSVMRGSRPMTCLGER